MDKKIIVLSGSPRSNGNTTALVEWFCEGARSRHASVEVVNIAALKNKGSGCLSCRQCQKAVPYECVIKDDITPVLARLPDADVIVMATPLYFFAASSQLKTVFDRMFSLYKWDNDAGTMETPLKGKTLAVLASAFEDVGLDALEAPFKLTADYTSMKYASLLVSHAGVSGQIRSKPDVRDQAFALGEKLAQ